MKIKYLITITAAIIMVNCVCAQNRRWEDIDIAGFHRCDTTYRHGYTLIFINKDSLLNAVTEQKLKDVFWAVYPKEVKRFNRNSLKTITIVVGTDYKGVAATLNGVVKIDQSWLAKNPEDVDLLTHELMHVVQGYGYNVPARWLTDGIADYGRYTFGINNEKSGWTLTPFKAGQSYNNTYRIAARFLVWTEKRKNKKVVEELDSALRNNSYQPEIWISLTGKTLDDLWLEYAADPRI